MLGIGTEHLSAEGRRLHDALAGFVDPRADLTVGQPAGQTSSSLPIPYHMETFVPNATSVSNMTAWGAPQDLLDPRAPQNHHRNDAKTPALQVPKTTRVKGKPRLYFIMDMPPHSYIMPAGGPLNFTMAEIIAILPRWFQNQDIATRFQNNGLSAKMHMNILCKYRYLELSTDHDRDRGREHLSDEYRTVMRKGQPDWKKANHVAPPGWNVGLILVNNFLPDEARVPGYMAPLPVSFLSLSKGLKMIPQDHDAGDLTRALDFAIRNQKMDVHGQQIDFLFPDDLHEILDLIGRTQVIDEHSDPYAVNRYATKVREASWLQKRQASEVRHQSKKGEMLLQQPLVHHLQPHVQAPYRQPTQAKYPPLPQHLVQNAQRQYGQGRFSQRLYRQPYQQQPSGTRVPLHFDVNWSGMPPMGFDILAPAQPQVLEQLVPQYPNHIQNIAGGSNYKMASQDLFPRLTAQEAAAVGSSTPNLEQAATTHAQHSTPRSDGFPPIPGVCNLSPLMNDAAAFQDQPSHEPLQNEPPAIATMEDMNALIDYNALLAQTIAVTNYPPDMPLRDCIEGTYENDYSDLARAAHFVRHPNMAWSTFTVADLGYVIGLLNASTAGEQQASANLEVRGGSKDR